MKNRTLNDFFQPNLGAPLSRKKFLAYSAFSGAALLLGTPGCKEDEAPPGPDMPQDVGGGDTGILNFAYALEQLEAAFYIEAAASFYGGITEEERSILTDIRDHEIAHRDFFRAALGGDAIRELKFDFSSVDFGSRDSVLGTAKALEDTGVQAYNGAGGFLESGALLLVAGKIVSVEARHAAAIRDLLAPGSPNFAGDDAVDPGTGLDRSRTPNEGGNSSIVATANSFLVTKISANQLP